MIVPVVDHEARLDKVSVSLPICIGGNASSSSSSSSWPTLVGSMKRGNNLNVVDSCSFRADDAVILERRARFMGEAGLLFAGLLFADVLVLSMTMVSTVTVIIGQNKNGNNINLYHLRSNQMYLL